MIENIATNGKKMTDANKATLTSILAGQEGMAEWLSVLMASEEDWKNLADKIDATHDKAKEMADIKMYPLEGDVKILSSAFEARQLEIFEGVGSILAGGALIMGLKKNL